MHPPAIPGNGCGKLALFDLLEVVAVHDVFTAKRKRYPRDEIVQLQTMPHTFFREFVDVEFQLLGEIHSDEIMMGVVAVTNLADEDFAGLLRLEDEAVVGLVHHPDFVAS